MRAVLLLLLVAIAAVGLWLRDQRLSEHIAALEARFRPAPDHSAPESVGERLTALETTVKTLSESSFAQATDLAQLKQERDRLRKARPDLGDKHFGRPHNQGGPAVLQ